MRALVFPILAAVASAQTPPAEKRPETWQVIERIADETGLRADLDAIVAHLDGVVKERALSNVPSRVARGLREPWAVPEIAADVRTKLAAPFAARAPAGAKGPAPVTWSSLAANAASLCDLELSPEEPEAWKRVADPAVVGPALVAALSELAGELDEMAHASLARVNADRQKDLAAAHRQFAEIHMKTHDPKIKATAEEDAIQQAVTGDLWKTRMQPSLEAASIALRLAEPAFLASLPARLQGLTAPAASNDFGGDVLAIAGDSPATRVVIGGKGKTTYSGRAAIVIDLGGDDVYTRAAVVDDGESFVSIVLDLGGNDTYSGEGDGPVYACGGVAILVDVSGKDTYRGGRLALGSAAFGGFALLADLAGNDVYEAQGYDEGFGFGGVGLLYDRSGDDRYDGWGYAQGATLGFGLGALVDGEGNDSYLADGHFADVYGDSGPNVWNGESQGSANGIRPGLPGGVAALVDLAGRDTYRAGNFSQGGGYFLGFGLMFDGGGDDENFGTRYSQGFGVHQAIGIRWDAGGNDVYHTRTVANLGSAWDEGVGYFLDDAGNDVYEAGGLSLGSAANTAIAIFVDGGGKDRYVSGDARDTQGGTSDSSYHKMQSLGVLIDLGSAGDTYSRADRKDGVLTWQRWFGLFLDASEPSAAAVLKRPAGKLKAMEVPGRDT
jgi:hypothetical protein